MQSARFTRYGRPYRPPSNIGPRSTHGIPATYVRGCRCDVCRTGWAEARYEKESARRRARKLEAARALLREAGEL